MKYINTTPDNNDILEWFRRCHSVASFDELKDGLKELFYNKCVSLYAKYKTEILLHFLIEQFKNDYYCPSEDNCVYFLSIFPDYFLNLQVAHL